MTRPPAPYANRRKQSDGDEQREMEPARTGNKCEKLCSRKVQSAMMVLVKSARSFFPKKETELSEAVPPG